MTGLRRGEGRAKQTLSSFYIAASVLAALTMAWQGLPGDYIYQYMAKSPAAQTVLYSACALYKLRKILFVAVHPGVGSLLTGVLLAWYSLEGPQLTHNLSQDHEQKTPC